MMTIAARNLLGITAVLTLGTIGCASPVLVSPNCTDAGAMAIGLSLRDAQTGAVFPFNRVVAVARDAEYADTARVAIADSMRAEGGIGLAANRSGTYLVTVDADGYQRWMRSGVRVAVEPVCGRVVTQHLDVDLEPVNP